MNNEMNTKFLMVSFVTVFVNIPRFTRIFDEGKARGRDCAYGSPRF